MWRGKPEKANVPGTLKVPGTYFLYQKKHIELISSCSPTTAIL
jgi:hypothetical protein